MRTTPPALIEEYRRGGFWSDVRITDVFDDAVRSDPGRLAVVDPPNREAVVGGRPQRLSFEELDRLVSAFALRLMDLGLRRDDILLAQLPNVVEYVAVYLAAMRLGIVLSPLPMQFRHHELEQVLGLTRARDLLTVGSFKGTAPHEDALLAARLHGARVLVLGEQAPAGTTPLAAPPATDADLARLRSQLEGEPVSADDIATICWTSGTEGLPKGVPRSHNHWLAISHAHFDGAGIRPGEVLLNPFPLVNMAALGGCFLSWLRCAGTLVLHHPLDLPVYLAQVAAERPHYAIAPPAVLNMLLRDPQLLARTDLTSLRCIGSGSAPLEPAMIRGFHDRFGIEVVNLFGSNEGMSLASGAAEAPDPERRARYFPRFGRKEIPWPQRVASAIQTRIVDPDTGAEILEPGHPGEMQIRGPTVFDGYFRAPELTADAFTADGYFRTGDLFEIAGEGEDRRYYRFVGRLKQLIVRGGLKVAPEEVEAVLAQHPEIAEASAIGYPDPVLGERICAVVVPRRPGADVSLSSIQDFLRGSGVAVFKWPERVRRVEALPRNAVGKVVRSALAPLAERPD
jgi:acyl-CoA synthetase (AMP-forming)/AMP-acid ligase II